MIKDIQEEGRVVLKALITKADQGKTNKNTPYLSLTLEDSSGDLDAKYWNLTEEQVKAYKPGQVVKAKGDLIFHKNAKQLRVLRLDILEDENILEYTREAPAKTEDMERELDGLLDSLKNPVIEEITRELLRQYKNDFLSYPAAVKNHHNFVGGLAYHSLTMVRLAQTVLDLYPFLNRDLVIAGILLHDLGKVAELSQPVLPEYTPQGNLIGHISIMNTLIDRVACSIEEQDSEEVMLLKHMVLSHHGKMEYGSPVLPMIPEAEVLTLLDNLDARMYMMKESVDQTMPGCFGPRVFALDGRMIYHRKFDNPEDTASKPQVQEDAANSENNTQELKIQAENMQADQAERKA